MQRKGKKRLKGIVTSWGLHDFLLSQTGNKIINKIIY